jgi:hypothetical protein
MSIELVRERIGDDGGRHFDGRAGKFREDQHPVLVACAKQRYSLQTMFMPSASGVIQQISAASGNRQIEFIERHG